MSTTTQQKPVIILQQGSIGAEVTDLQYILQIRKFTANAPDAQFGPVTRAAVIRFQQSKNLVADGIVGAATWTAMGYTWPENQPGVFLREGDSSNAVQRMQQALLTKRFSLGLADGIFGSKTKAAVIQLQKNGDGERLSNTQGVVGPITWGIIMDLKVP
ncbi:peptidoglycan-binding protein [Coleofasciculus sp. FACHB-SPT9]|uniref:peptidoglycan-binding domain-containing protein n=1 Tax=Cyanophyceae TaxID=3028117 RepID=UPI0016879325|nr:peptidoglycan-binding protein [Coleofasciculus sp. FACHB-SPT9]MBD1889868.1 peptidoglycan-binding protein [Coleofasciculus sp. FACHB-SPT9]